MDSTAMLQTIILAEKGIEYSLCPPSNYGYSITPNIGKPKSKKKRIRTKAQKKARKNNRK